MDRRIIARQIMENLETPLRQCSCNKKFIISGQKKDGQMGKFWHIDRTNENIAMECNSVSARSAALKVATRNTSQICIADTSNGKLHVFQGSKRLLADHEKNKFTESRNITTKPEVRKMCYYTMNRQLERKDVSDIVRHLSMLIDDDGVLN